MSTYKVLKDDNENKVVMKEINALRRTKQDYQGKEKKRMQKDFYHLI